MIVFSVIKRCQNPQLTQIVQKANKSYSQADAIAEENSAVQEYSRFIDDSQASREALFVELLSAQERTAEAEVHRAVL